MTATCNSKTYTFQAIIADTCADTDCDGCCTRNSHPTTGYLVDMEYYTVVNVFGTTSCADGNIDFSIDLSQPPVYKNCGVGYGGYGCGGGLCCSADSYCGKDPISCGPGCQNYYGPCTV